MKKLFHYMFISFLSVTYANASMDYSIADALERDIREIRKIAKDGIEHSDYRISIAEHVDFKKYTGRNNRAQEEAIKRIQVYQSLLDMISPSQFDGSLPRDTKVLATHIGKDIKQKLDAYLKMPRLDQSETGRKLHEIDENWHRSDWTRWLTISEKLAPYEVAE